MPRGVSVCERKVDGLWVQSDSLLLHASELRTPDSDGTKGYVSSTVHLGTVLADNQLDALIKMYLFISLLYMFRAPQCSSSGESIVTIHHMVYIYIYIYITLCRWPSGIYYSV